MYAEPEDLDRAEVARALAVHWGIAAPLRYLPVGFGTHHYRAGEDWFATSGCSTPAWIRTRPSSTSQQPSSRAAR